MSKTLILTPKQDKLIDITIDNAISKDKKVKTKKTMLKEAGYIGKSLNNPAQIYDSEKIKAELAIRTAKVVKAMERERDRAISLLERKAPKAPYNHLVNGADILQKNINLLSGKATEHKAIKIEISQEMVDKYNPTPAVVVSDIVDNDIK